MARHIGRLDVFENITNEIPIITKIKKNKTRPPVKIAHRLLSNLRVFIASILLKNNKWLVLYSAWRYFFGGVC
jgi:hypothetical protein